ncbi:MAG: SBBP repeat-containing protein, partial [Deltaproteobacteria bacterium]|nr:SBBP repeat-containing protein [Deltaproteobacteria bacterium]
IDAFLTKFDSSGNKVWTKQWGTSSYDYAYSVAVDSSGNLYVAGSTEGSLDGNTSAGSSDAFLTKFDSSENKVWTKQWGTSSGDFANSVAVDPSGNLYVAGFTAGSLDGNTSASGGDAFLTKFDSSGNKVWTKQWGTSSGDGANSVAMDNNGNIIIAGYTESSFPGYTNAGDIDILLISTTSN